MYIKWQVNTAIPYNVIFLKQRIANHTQTGGPDMLHLEYFAEALTDPLSDLTYPALYGAMK